MTPDQSGFGGALKDVQWTSCPPHAVPSYTGARPGRSYMHVSGDKR